MRVIACFLMYLAMAGHAMALSCIRPDVARTFSEFEATGLPYMIVKGELYFDKSELPKADGSQAMPKKTVIMGHMSGHSLTFSGFEAAFDQPVKLTVECVSVWCGGAAAGQDILAFLSRKASGYSLVLSPCGGSMFEKPTQDMLDRVQHCFKGAPCHPQ